MTERYHFECPASLDCLPELRELVASACRQHGIDEETCFALQLCADEAATNIIIYGYDGMQAGRLMVDLEILPDQASLTLTDRGRAFDPECAPLPDVTVPIEQRQPGGLGLYLIRKLMDNVAYDSMNGVNRLTLTKARQPAGHGSASPSTSLK
jgi:serine/threonine-protein kinase RsbW